MEPSPALETQRSKNLGRVNNGLADLRALFEAVPIGWLDRFVKDPHTRGRPQQYRPQSLFRLFLVRSYYGLSSNSETVRLLRGNPGLRRLCGLPIGQTPSRPTLSKFFSKLAQHPDLLLGALHQLTSDLSGLLPGLGEHTSIDGTLIRSHSSRFADPPTDPDATRTGRERRTGGESKWHWGYSLHLISCSRWELPLTVYLRTASSSDMVNFLPLLQQAKDAYPWLETRTCAGDKGYDSEANYRASVETFGITPIIATRSLPEGKQRDIIVDMDELGRPRCIGGQSMTPVVRGPSGSFVYRCPGDGCGKRVGKPWIRCDDVTALKPSDDYRLVCAIPRWSKQWTRLYRKRTSVERVFGRLKGSRGLNAHRYRGLAKVQTHCLIAILTMQVAALVQARAGRIDELRQCLSKVA